MAIQGPFPFALIGTWLPEYGAPCLIQKAVLAQRTVNREAEAERCRPIKTVTPDTDPHLVPGSFCR